MHDAKKMDGELSSCFHKNRTLGQVHENDQQQIQTGKKNLRPPQLDHHVLFGQPNAPGKPSKRSSLNALS